MLSKEKQREHRPSSQQGQGRKNQVKRNEVRVQVFGWILLNHRAIKPMPLLKSAGIIRRCGLNCQVHRKMAWRQVAEWSLASFLQRQIWELTKKIESRQACIQFHSTMAQENLGTAFSRNKLALELECENANTVDIPKKSGLCQPRVIHFTRNKPGCNLPETTRMLAGRARSAFGGWKLRVCGVYC